MFDSPKLSYMKLNYFSTISFALIILFIIFADIIISNSPIHFDSSDVNNHPNLLHSHQSPRILKITSARAENTLRLRLRLRLRPRPRHEDPILFGAPGRRSFDSRLRNFFARNQCRTQAFMTWISPLTSFGQRELFGLGTLFQSNPATCLIILSESMDSRQGLKLLEPLTERGFRVKALAPDLCDLTKNTPAEKWLAGIKNGAINPGEIPLAQNLSNLIRLAVLYKYGGVYLDTDFIILKNFEGLRNSIGAQSTDQFGNWTRLNNAVLVFDRNHPLVLKFLEEFASTFNGNVWGYNGPYLVSRVVEKLGRTSNEFLNFTVLSPMAFYPVPWMKVAGFFSRPSNRTGEKWVEAKIRQLNGSTYGVHLWNSQSGRLKIEEGSIIERLIYQHCLICRDPTYDSTS